MNVVAIDYTSTRGRGMQNSSHTPNRCGAIVLFLLLVALIFWVVGATLGLVLQAAVVIVLLVWFEPRMGLPDLARRFLLWRVHQIGTSVCLQFHSQLFISPTEFMRDLLDGRFWMYSYMRSPSLASWWCR